MTRGEAAMRDQQVSQIERLLIHWWLANSNIAPQPNHSRVRRRLRQKFAKDIIKVAEWYAPYQEPTVEEFTLYLTLDLKPTWDT